jgi:hypothetical protein
MFATERNNNSLDHDMPEYENFNFDEESVYQVPML